MTLSDVGTYNDQELEMYKQIWSEINRGVECLKRVLLIYCIIFWLEFFLLGYLLIACLYYLRLSQSREMEQCRNRDS